MGYEKTVSVAIFSKTGENHKELKIVRENSQGRCCLFIAKLTPLTALHKTGVETIFDLK
jgi:hypothetical protein